MTTPSTARGHRRTFGEAWAEWDFHAGRAVGWEAGYRAGFDVGVDIGGAGLLLAIEHALPAGVLLDLLPDMPYAGEYRRLQRARQLDRNPCRRGCGRCSQCVYAAAVVRNLAAYGSPDYPGGPVPWTLPAAQSGQPRGPRRAVARAGGG